MPFSSSLHRIFTFTFIDLLLHRSTASSIYCFNEQPFSSSLHRIFTFTFIDLLLHRSTASSISLLHHLVASSSSSTKNIFSLLHHHLHLHQPFSAFQKEEVDRFYKAYRKYGKDWKKAYLSLPEGTASVVRLNVLAFSVSDEVKSGKPSPDLFLEAASRMGVDASCCLVIEDSLVGIKAGKAAHMQVVAVPSIQTESDQYSIADYVIHSFLDFQPQLWGLPPFDDWVMKALPIDPIHFKGSYKNGFLEEVSGYGINLI
ncbi:hypothetical protein QVD17_30966 [Tagetes erecta]|uniref:Uncharacterized protein n=1 Tax=Tagetes erecta TaxID=13708 RepID=A0AAD8K4L5_TARER|nr:hypothetical protein QVD17_30966 [Tagetes erecta]